MANTSNTVAALTFITGTFTQVFSGDYTPQVGTNDIIFTTPFAWNGTSNLLIQICWSNNNGGGAAAEVAYDVTSYNSLAYFRNDNESVSAMCGETAATARQANRPQIRLTMKLPPVPTGYSWSDGTNTVGTTNPLTVNPVSNTTYTASIMALGCPVLSNGVSIIANPLPATPGANASTQCGTGVPTAFVTTGGGGAGYKWYLTQFGGTAIPGETAAALTSYSINTTTHFWVSESNGSCESVRADVLATVNQPGCNQCFSE